MPEMDGVTFLREALRRYPDMAVIMLTGVAEVSTAVECLKLGALDYISKPVLLEEVRARVDKALEKRQLVLQNRFYQKNLEARVRELDRRNKQSLINGVQTLVHALEAKDAYTSGHSSRVSRYAVKTAVQMGYTGELLEQIRLGGELHDIGKIGTREDVLNKPGAAHARGVRAHQGAHDAGRADPGAVPGRVADACSGSCARITSGWTAAASPTGPAGQPIPAEARIVAVVDAFDAMTTNRAYRPPRSPAEAIDELRACARHPFRPRSGERLPAARLQRSPRAPAVHLSAPVPAMSDTLMISVSGMRGHVGTDLTPELVARHAAALGAWVRLAAAGRTAARGRPWCSGRDARTSGPMFARAAAAGLMSVGVDVIDVGVVPTPTVQLAVEHHHAGAGLILTASHNPIEWNALKFVGPDGIFLDAEAGARVRALAEEGPPRMGWDGLGEVRQDRRGGRASS